MARRDPDAERVAVDAHLPLDPGLSAAQSLHAAAEQRELPVRRLVEQLEHQLRVG